MLPRNLPPNPQNGGRSSPQAPPRVGVSPFSDFPSSVSGLGNSLPTYLTVCDSVSGKVGNDCSQGVSGGTQRIRQFAPAFRGGEGGLRAPRGKKSPASCESEAGSSLRLWIRAPARVSQILNHRRTSTKLGSSAVSSSNNAPRKYSTATASARTQWVGAPVCCVATGTTWSEGGRGRERRQKSATRRRPAVGILWGSYGDPVGIR